MPPPPHAQIQPGLGLLPQSVIMNLAPPPQQGSQHSTTTNPNSNSNPNPNPANYNNNRKTGNPLLVELYKPVFEKRVAGSPLSADQKRGICAMLIYYTVPDTSRLLSVAPRTIFRVQEEYKTAVAARRDLKADSSQENGASSAVIPVGPDGQNNGTGMSGGHAQLTASKNLLSTNYQTSPPGSLSQPQQQPKARARTAAITASMPANGDYFSDPKPKPGRPHQLTTAEVEMMVQMVDDCPTTSFTALRMAVDNKVSIRTIQREIKRYRDAATKTSRPNSNSTSNRRKSVPKPNTPTSTVASATNVTPEAAAAIFAATSPTTIDLTSGPEWTSSCGPAGNRRQSSVCVGARPTGTAAARNAVATGFASVSGRVGRMAGNPAVSSGVMKRR